MMMSTNPRGVAQLEEQRSPKPRVAGSNPVIPAMNVSWAAVVAAVLCVSGLLCGGFAMYFTYWELFAFSGLLELSGIGFALLALNDKD